MIYVGCASGLILSTVRFSGIISTFCYLTCGEGMGNFEEDNKKGGNNPPGHPSDQCRSLLEQPREAWYVSLCADSHPNEYH